MIKTGYKLVLIPEYCSLLAQPPYTLYYRVGSVVASNPGTVGIMIFDSIDLAVSFNAGLVWPAGRCALLEVEYSDASVIEVDAICYCYGSKSLDDFYSKPLSAVCSTIRPPPLGTVCCTAITVIRVVSDNWEEMYMGIEHNGTSSGYGVYDR